MPLAALGLTVDPEGVKKGLGEGKAHFDKFEHDLDTSSKHMEAALARVEGVVRLVERAFEAWLSIEGIHKILEATDNFRRLEIQLTATAGSAGAAQAQLAWIKQFANDNPSNLNQVTQAFQRLQAAGLNPMSGQLQTLQDAVSAFGGSGQQLIQAVDAIAHASKSTTLDMRTLRGALNESIPSAALIMAKQLGMSLDELAYRTRTGSVTTKHALDALFAGLQTAYGGASAQMLNTFGGQMVQLHGAWEELLVAIGNTGVYEYFTGWVKQAVVWVRHAEEAVKDWKNTVLEAIDAVLEWVEANQELVTTLAAAVAAGLAMSALLTVLEVVKSAFFGLSAFLLGPIGLAALSVGAYMAWRTNLFGIRDLLMAFTQDVGTSFESIAGHINRALLLALSPKSFFDRGGMAEWGSFIEAQNAKIDALRSKMMATPVMKAVEPLLPSAGAFNPLERLADLYDLINKGMKGEGPVNYFVDQLQLVLDKIVAGVKNVRAAVGGMPGSTDPFKSRQSLMFGETDAAAVPPWMTRFLDSLKLLFGGDSAFVRVMDDLKETLLSHMGKAGGIIKAGMAEAAKGDWVGAIIEMAAAFTLASKTFQAFIGKLDKVIEMMQTVFEPLTESLDALGSILTEVGALFVAIVRPFVQLINSSLAPVLKALSDALTGILAAFGITVQGDPYKVVSELAANQTIQLKLDASQALSELHRAQDAILGAGDDATRQAARQAFLSARAAAILAEQAAAGQPAGAPTVTGNFWDGLRDILGHWGTQLANAFADVLRPLFSDITTGLRSLGNFLRDVLKPIGDAVGGLGNILHSILDPIGRVLHDIFGGISSLVTVLPKGLAGVFNEVDRAWNGITHYIQQAWQGILNYIQQAWQGILDYIYRFWKAIGGRGAGGGGYSQRSSDTFGLPAGNTAGGWGSQASAPGGSGGGLVVLLVDRSGNVTPGSASDMQEWARTALLSGLTYLERRGDINPVTA